MKSIFATELSTIFSDHIIPNTYHSMDENPINNEKLTTQTFILIVDNSTSLKETFLVYWYRY